MKRCLHGFTASLLLVPALPLPAPRHKIGTLPLYNIILGEKFISVKISTILYNLITPHGIIELTCLSFVLFTGQSLLKREICWDLKSIHEQQVYRFPTCSLSFNRQDALKRHLRQHSTRLKFKNDDMWKENNEWELIQRRYECRQNTLARAWLVPSKLIEESNERCVKIWCNMTKRWDILCWHSTNTVKFRK